MDHLEGKKVVVSVTGRCDITHENLLLKLQHIGLTEAKSRSDCDYEVVFCSISSRIATDISEAEKQIRDDKPVILVVMHPKHTLDGTIGDSTKHVTKGNIHLTVDCLFYRDNFLDCNFNDKAWGQIETFFEVNKPVLQRRFWTRWCVFGVTCFCMLGSAAVGLLIYYGLVKKSK